jgi:hypothetical protein
MKIGAPMTGPEGKTLEFNQDLSSPKNILSGKFLFQLLKRRQDMHDALSYIWKFIFYYSPYFINAYSFTLMNQRIP